MNYDIKCTKCNRSIPTDSVFDAYAQLVIEAPNFKCSGVEAAAILLEIQQGCQCNRYD